ncbi:MAG: glycosyltransferase family 2 protein, partial [Muribaculaceae bacterium]|nr:glycosyltransferase family 2 protein [Muribaculaceae bacterium]
MEGALISVIVPAYNVEAYLAQCLDSLLAQTYRNLEIIVVDDGSTDGTGALADDYAVADDRVRVIHQRNGGLSAARNAALNVMTGSLVMMVDSDDYVAPNCVATLLHTLESTESDIAMGQWHTFSGQPPVAVTAGKGR